MATATDRYVTNPYARSGAALPAATFTAADATSRAMAIVPELERCAAQGAMPKSTGRLSANKSVYTGLGGVAYAFLRLGQHKFGGNGDDDDDERNRLTYLRRARDLAMGCLDDDEFRQPGSAVSFYCGAPGCLAIGCVSSALLGETVECQLLLDKLLAISEAAMVHQDDELLFGRAGYIYSLLYVRSQLRAANVSETKKRSEQFATALRRVSDRIIESGRSRARRSGYAEDGWPLMWHCFGEPYVGAAHGVIGILAMLFHCFEYISQESRDMVRQTMIRLLRSRHESGNPPIVLGDTRDEHVHWCHGSPGLPAMLAAAVGRDGDSDGSLMKAALKAGDDIWRRGVLLKGNGLCHGIAGNAYAFLTLYRSTGEAMYLDRARAFALLLDDQQVQNAIRKQPGRQRRVVGMPDSPSSLMEGSAGVLCFLLDLSGPEKAAFPGWEI